MQEEYDSGFSKRVSEIKDQYVTEFDPKQYCLTYYYALDEELKFFLKCYHEAFQKEPILTSRGQAQRRVLDFGCGPVPVYAATASSFTNSITMAEILPLNRMEIEKWMNSDEDAMDWEIFFGYLASLKDGDGSCSVKVAQRLKDVFQLVLPCDGVLANPIYPVCQTYDVVMSSLCIEFATKSLADYRSMVGNVIHLLRPDGILMMTGALGNTYYNLGRHHQYPSANLRKEDVEAAVISHGLQVVTLRTLARQTSMSERPADHQGLFFLVAHRPVPK